MPTRARAVLPVVAVAAVGFASLLGACNADPVHEAEVQALGSELPGVPVGQYHRAGQPCGVCHGGEGPAKMTFVIAGTVFSGKTNTVGVDQATVALEDDQGSYPHVLPQTNCVGNFFVTTDLWQPQYPIEVSVGGLGSVPNVLMPGHIGRENSCAACHQLQAGLDSAGPVFITFAAPTMNPNCPISPVLQLGE